MSVQSNGQPLVLPQVETTRRINGYNRRDFNDPAHRAFHNVRSRLTVSQRFVAGSESSNTIDCSTVKNSTGEGVRIEDERFTQDRLAVNERELVIAMTSPTSPSVSSLTGFIRFDTVTKPGLGITQQWLDDKIAADGNVEKIPILVQGIYSIEAFIEIAPYNGGNPNCFQQVYVIKTDQIDASDTALVDVLAVKSIVRKTSDAGAKILIEGSSILRYEVQLDDEGNPVLDGDNQPAREGPSNDISIFYQRNKTSHPITVTKAELRLKLLVSDL
uniref:Uncharacterized protein n=1 Tax=Clandestinovirus TaxID=2831644 RepID=A0A8F8KLK2_9VIRU|nr:hypothetical protein KOM_12_345 [Clandestinovirus]